jgi:hypothetical protein
MPQRFTRPLTIAFGALAAMALSGCYDGGVYGAGYASRGDCAARYGNAYYDYDGYAYDDGYGYDCYDASDYGGGFVQIGFGGGWYDDYYYPGHGLWMFDSYRNRYPLNGQYLNYWGGRRAWWKHHGKRGDGKPGRPGWHRDRDRDDDRGRGDGRPNWNRGDRDDDGPRGTRPRRPVEGATDTPGVIRPLPPADPGESYSRPRGGAASRRDRGAIRRDRVAPTTRPAAVRRPDPQSRPAPAAAPRPAAAAPKPAPVARPAPTPRPNRADRPARVRDN